MRPAPHPHCRPSEGRRISPLDLRRDRAALLREGAAVVQARAIIAARADKLGLSVPDYLQRRALRHRARDRGLAYWPALMWRPREDQQWVDRRAFTAAERVMTRIHGHRWGDLAEDKRSRGGWDSKSVYGLSADDVARAWIAAGCRDSRKFRLVIAARAALPRQDGDCPDLLPSRRMSLRQTRDYIRGWRWVYSSRTRSDRPRPQQGLDLCWSRQALIALGRLSPVMRSAAVASLRGSDHDGRVKIRLRHLDWAAVAAAQRHIAAASAERRPVVLAAFAGHLPRAATALGMPHDSGETAVVAQLTPQYPRLPYALAAAILQGRDPADGLLAKQERHRWLTDGAPEMATWLADHLGLPRHRSIRVLRWLAMCRQQGRWAALERERTTRIPGGDLRRWAAISVLDEIQDEDIVTGRDSVDDVLERAARRLGDAWLTRAMSDHRPLASLPSWAQGLPRRMRLLRSAADLAIEGKEMEHCVGGYVEAVRRGQCHILSLRSAAGRSTIELSPALEIIQHRGARNGAPPRWHEQLARALCVRIGAHRRAAA